jgi:regulator of sigma E protease
MALINYIYVAAAVVLLFGAAVFVHEFGHFWMARRRGLKVEAFAIGFGPKILGWTRDGIDYSWRWIPAGGYVKLPQMITSEALEGKAENGGEVIPPAAPGAKIMVAFAGPCMNALLAVVIATIIYFVGLPVLVNPPIIGDVEAGSPEAKLGIQAGDRVVQVDGKPVTTWQEIGMIAILARTNVIPVAIQRDEARTTYQLALTPNPVLGGKMLNLEPKYHTEVMDVLAGGAADKAGIKAKDVILAFAGVPIAGRDQLIELIQKRAGIPSEIRVERDGQRLNLTVSPLMDPATKTGRIGVQLGSSNHYQLQVPGPLPWVNIADVVGKTVDTFSALFHSRQTGVGFKDLSGPPGILAMLATQVNTNWRLALNFMVLLNVSLAVINLLPLPVLDGGHILIAIIEKIRRRPLSVRLLEYTTTGFAVLLITFMLYVSFNDFKRWRIFKDIFKQPSQIESVEKPPVTPAPNPTTP